MEKTPIVNRWRWRRWTLLAIGLLAISLLVLCGGLIVLLEIPLTLAVGWPWYLRRVLSQVNKYVQPLGKVPRDSLFVYIL